MRMTWRPLTLALLLLAGCAPTARQEGSRERLRRALDAVPAIDAHDHLHPPDRLPGLRDTPQGRGMTLAGLWRTSYYPWLHPLPDEGTLPFPAWWAAAQDGFRDARATGFYRVLLPAFEDLYGADFGSLSAKDAADLDAAVFRNSRDPDWIRHVVVERANIERVLNDPCWSRLAFSRSYPFESFALNVTMLGYGFHRAEFKDPNDDPYAFAEREGLPMGTLQDYIAVLDRLFAKAKAEWGAVCVKSTVAYSRPLAFERVPLEEAAKAFGRPREALTETEIRRFEDFMMWVLAALAARHELPFQIHTGPGGTGLGGAPGSNPLHLVGLVQGNPGTRFVVMHGGFPWVDDTLALAIKCPNVWVDASWLATWSPAAARQAFHAWLDVLPASRILWGADGFLPEQIYGATVRMRECLAEVLAERVDRGELSEDDALHIGRQILRENALMLFPFGT